MTGVGSVVPLPSEEQASDVNALITSVSATERLRSKETRIGITGLGEPTSARASKVHQAGAHG